MNFFTVHTLHKSRTQCNNDAWKWYTMTLRNDDDVWWRRRTTTHDDARKWMTTTYVGLQWRHATTNDNGWQWQWLLSVAGSYYCKPRFTNLLILPTYNFNLNDMQSTVISITCQSQIMTLKRLVLKSPKLIDGYTPLIGPEAWQSTMGKRRMSSASTSIFYPLPHPPFYHRPLTCLNWGIQL